MDEEEAEEAWSEGEDSEMEQELNKAGKVRPHTVPASPRPVGGECCTPLRSRSHTLAPCAMICVRALVTCGTCALC